MKRALTIAGSDSGGGAGIQADLKTFCAFGVYGMSSITSITAQNTKGVEAIFDLPPSLVAKQIECVASDIGVDAAKTGMLSNSSIIEVVAQEIKKFNIEKLVVDPVMVSKSGALLLQRDAVDTLVGGLFPLSFLITPNLPEASFLVGEEIKNVSDMERACVSLKKWGPRYVLLKGGHLPGEEIVDILFDGERFISYPAPRVATKNTHGTGCTYSAAICALLALGYPITEAVKVAREYMSEVIAHSLNLGKGFGPVNHLAPLFLRGGVNPEEGGKYW
ncbi:MAG TPA: bifunctional hydroxymethylpyrimidine kinase/phosphomethylpyrimidine kinase [Candidatus Atribacteria bacterium]|nr:bifunctional hydroxymethylpyrimidine kinase/phosphomethylpyrimidine kinase [Candidatus Atribacteria bacterium]